MSQKKSASKPAYDEPDRGTPFDKMTRQKKTIFVVKVLVCALSFGFLFADVMNS